MSSGPLRFLILLLALCFLIGPSYSDAQQQALEELNGNESLAEELRLAARPLTNAPIGSSNHGGFLTGLLYDLKIAIRNVRTKPGFSLMVIPLRLVGCTGSPVRVFALWEA